MSDPLVLSISMASAVVLLIVGTMIYLHFDQKRDFKERALELKMFRMENTRIIQEWRKDTVAHLKTMGLPVEQIYEILGRADEAH
jgi:1,2-phenylacetyl-CoA epoxidase catalytic subunit